MKRLFFAAALVIFALISCNDVPINTEVNQNKLPISISPSSNTRVTDINYDVNDEVGLYVVNYNGNNAGILSSSDNHINNVRFTYSGTVWTPDQEIYWKDNTTKADFYAYHPYQEVNDINALPFTVAADQRSLADYKGSDFMWGKATAVAPTASPVAITTNHIMSNLLIYLDNGDGFTEEEFKAADISVKINNVKCNANINLSTGTVTAIGAASEVLPFKETDHYRALLVPQTVNANDALVIITVNGTEYSVKQAMTLSGNTRHKITISIDKDKPNSNAVFNVGSWVDDQTGYSGTITIENDLENFGYIDEYGINHGKGITIGETVWAPVNCGYHATDFKYGKLYQWGRKYGQGYDTDAIVPSFEYGVVTAYVGNQESNSNVFFKTTDMYIDWTSPQNDKLWNSGSEDAPIKTEYDPCPTGWRVPTYTELNKLGQNYSSRITNNDIGQKGRWFSGQNTYTANAPQIFLVCAGGRYGSTGGGNEAGTVSGRDESGIYGSSSPNGHYSYTLRTGQINVEIEDNTARALGMSIRCVHE